MTPVLAIELSEQVVFSGAVTGITYGIMAVGVILIYRSSRIINFAIAEMGGFAAALCAFLVINVGVGYWVAFAASIVAGALVGCAMELLVVRRLFDAPRVILLVAMIGAIVLTLRERAGVRRQRIPEQVGRSRAEAVAIVKVPLGGAVAEPVREPGE